MITSSSAAALTMTGRSLYAIRTGDGTVCRRDFSRRFTAARLALMANRRIFKEDIKSWIYQH